MIGSLPALFAREPFLLADYSTSSSNANTALNNSTDGGLVEEYEIGPRTRRVKRGKLTDQVEATVKLEALAARRSSGLFRLAKFRSPRS